MKTRVLRLDGSSADDAKIRTAARAVRDGRLVVFPTETVYGLATNADDAAALRRLCEVKLRDPAKPFALMIPEVGRAEHYVGRVPELARKLMRLFWPGPLTIVVHAEGGRTVGLRLPDHPVARAVVAWADCPVAAPSANRAGVEPAASAQEALRQLGGRIDLVLDGGAAREGRSSTVVLIRDHEAIVLREGPIPEAEVRAAADYTVLFVCAGNSCRSPMAEDLLRRALARRSRGGRHRACRVLSAGTGVMREGEVNPRAVEVMAEAGLDISGHRSRPLSVSMVAAADRTYTMTEKQRAIIIEMVPAARGRVQRLDSGGDLLDPAGEDLAAYRACRDRIANLVERMAGETP